MTIARSRRFAAFLALAAGSVALGDLLLFVDSPGWTRGAALVAAGALVVLRHRPARWPAGGLACLAALAAAAAAQAYDGGWLSTAVGVAAIVGLALVGRGERRSDALAWLDAGARALGDALAKPISDARLVARWRERHPRALAFLRLARWLGPLLLGGVFLALFAWSNPLVERAFGDACEALRAAFAKLTLPPATRWCVWLGSAIAAWALLRLRPSRAGAPRRVPIASVCDAALAQRRLGFVIRSLVVCNGVFLVETLLDLRYLWAGAGLPAGTTYAGYAHRGAYPLVATALLAAGFVLAWFRPGSAAERSRVARMLVSLWLAQDVMLIASAALRLRRYIDAYALTEWRLATAAWMALVAIGLVSIAWRILAQRANSWLIDVNAAATAALFLAWGFIDQDALIAWHDATHCHEVGGEAAAIDIEHLAGLGPQAGPALAWLAGRSADGVVAQRAADAAAELSARLDAVLADRRAWTVARSRAATAMSAATGAGPAMSTRARGPASMGGSGRSRPLLAAPAGKNGIDLLGDSIELTTAKQARSAARRYGRPGVMSEPSGVTTWGVDTTGHTSRASMASPRTSSP